MRNYSIGLDIGTTSVGWVCMDESYQILKYNNRKAFGVHEFEAAEVAEGRRLKRGTRRRYNRRKKRIQLLQSLFEPNIEHPSFFVPFLSQHKWSNDNQFENRTLSQVLRSLRMNPSTYPTIFHLRKELVESHKKEDLRLVYLAIHNLVKFRGHFLQEGTGWNTSSRDTNLIEQFEQFIIEYTELEELPVIEISQQQLKEIETILLDTYMNKSEKVRHLNELLSKQYEAFFKLIVGLDVPLTKLFTRSGQALLYKETKSKVNLNSETLEEILSELLELESRFIESLQPFYQQIALFDLLKGSGYVAQAKVIAFDQYNQDLRDLKSIIDQVFGEKVYRAYFMTSKSRQNEYKKTHNIELLCKLVRFNNEKKFEEKFYTGLVKLLKTKENDDVINEALSQKITKILIAIGNRQFLVKQKGIQNAAIPYQNSLYEAEQILKNQQVHYSFMTDEWIQKVKQIISFRIPYYIGPLVNRDEQSEFAWLKRKHDGAITPWNFDEQIDKAASAEAFITRMTNNCTYLKQKKVLPKQSLLYEKYEVLNELNSVQLRGTSEEPDRKHRLSPEIKVWIINNVFKKSKTITIKKLIQELKKSEFLDELYDVQTGELKQIYGTQKEDRFATSLSTYISLKTILDDAVELDVSMVEEIIYWLTVFNEKDIIAFKINKKYPHITSEQIKRLVKLNLSGWGRLSYDLLNGIPVDDANRSVIEHMEQYAINFMELMSPRYSDLAKKIQNINQLSAKKVHKIRYEDIEQLAGSPALKRGIWRSVKLIEELVDIFGEPVNIVIEVAREDQASKRTKSRKKQWEDIEKNVNRNDKELKQFFNEMSKYPEQLFNQRSFWLYVTQQGKCLYTGQALDINNLSMYEVDHILPRNYVKDDSFDNLALVLPKANQQKNQVGQNKMPLEIIDPALRYHITEQWKYLNKLGLISSSKLGRLMKPKFDDIDKDKFIARQLVETRQIIKNVRDLLQERFEHTDIHLIKAGIVSKFRKFNSIPKIRDYNNKHHAIDALLATVLIQFILNEYGHNFLQFDMSRKDVSKKWAKMAQNHKQFFLFQQFAEQKIKSPVTKQHVLGLQYFEQIYYDLPWQTTKMTQTGDGMFYKESILSPKVKTPNYNSEKALKYVHDAVTKNAIYCIHYKFLENGKEVEERKFVDFKVIEKYQLKDSTLDERAMYLAQREVKEVITSANVVKILYKYQKIWIDEFPYYFISTSELHNARQFELSKEIMQQIETLNDETSVEVLRDLFKEIVDIMLGQYQIYNKASVTDKISDFINQELVDVNTFTYGFTEIKKAVAANAQRSDKFGSRITKSPKFEEVKIVEESITALRYRKPKNLWK